MLPLAGRRIVGVLTLLGVVACGDKGTGTAKSVASSIELATTGTVSGTVGTVLGSAPSFVVKDQRGAPMADVPVTVAVTSGGGSLAAAPTVSLGGATSVGTWTLGTVAGANAVTVSSGTLTPLVISAQGVAGVITTLVPQTATTIPGAVVGQTVSARARAKDAFGNVAVGQAATVSTTGGGVAPSTAIANDAGDFVVSAWQLGATPGANTLTITAGSAVAQFTATTVAALPSSVVVTSGNAQTQLAGKSLSAPITFTVRDQTGNGIPNTVVTFSVTGGNGTLSTTTATAGAGGVVTAPTWTLGNSVVPQSIRASAGSGANIVSATATATVASDFNITVYFYGPAMTAEQQALFTGAAARISAIITGDIASIGAFGIDAAQFCSEPGLPVMNEVIDDIVIFASIASIDGPGSVLAQAGPCASRSGGTHLPAIGMMQFDIADIGSLAAGGTLQDVITHEMMHVIGMGTYWNGNGLLTGYNTSSVSYIGLEGGAGCRAVGGSTVCATSVPVENTGGAGTANGHWRESVFGSELMTGWTNAGGMPISRMTIGAFLDLGYEVNYDAASLYGIPGTSAARFSIRAPTSLVAPQVEWERIVTPKVLISSDGQITEIK